MRQLFRRYPLSSVLGVSVLLHLLIGWLIVVPFNFTTANQLVEQPLLAVPIQIKILEAPPRHPAKHDPSKIDRMTPQVATAPPPITRSSPAKPSDSAQLSLKSADDPELIATEQQPTNLAADAVLDDFEFDLDAPEPYYPPPIDAWDRDITAQDQLSFQDPDAPITADRVLTEQFARGVFPQQIKSIYQGEVIGIDFELQQTWTLNDQQQYQIVTEAEKFGFKVRAISTGQVTASGLLPSQFEISINQQRHAWATFNPLDRLIHYGVPATQSVNWISGGQDLNTIFYQLALLQQSVADRQLQVAAVNQVYAVDLKYSERRPTRLPTGVVLTDVLTATDLQGQFSGEARFAPALGNYPVAIRVKYGRFDVKLSLQQLKMDGVTVWGR